MQTHDEFASKSSATTERGNSFFFSLAPCGAASFRIAQTSWLCHGALAGSATPVSRRNHVVLKSTNACMQHRCCAQAVFIVASWPDLCGSDQKRWADVRACWIVGGIRCDSSSSDRSSRRPPGRSGRGRLRCRRHPCRSGRGRHRCFQWSLLSSPLQCSWQLQQSNHEGDTLLIAIEPAALSSSSL